MTTEALTMNRDAANDLVKRFREDCDIRRLVSTRNYVSYAAPKIKDAMLDINR